MPMLMAVVVQCLPSAKTDTPLNDDMIEIA
jgi:hypothetical protein